MQVLQGMKIRAKKDEVLEKLKKNRELHSAIVKEARDGFVEKAKAAVEKRLELLRQGKVVSLSFSLSPPLDYTEVYDTAIAMLSLHQDEFVELDATQVTTLYNDKWGWTQQFYGANMHYSKIASDRVGASLGSDDE